MSAQPRALLHRLLDYIGEQLKQIDPRGYRLASQKTFLRRCAEIAGLPGVEFDVRVEGDHTWLRIARLEAGQPPAVSAKFRSGIQVWNDPNGPAPALDEAAFQHWLSAAARGKSAKERVQLEQRGRVAAELALEEYKSLWAAWAAGEKPRRKTIGLYGDLFAIKHALEAEETSKPTELVWGIGVSSWQLPFTNATVAFEYPLLTQAVEISLDEEDMSLEIRPKVSDTRVELDAFVACSVAGAADVERAVREDLVRNKERPVSPFDPASYSAVLKLVASNLESEGSYQEVLARDLPIPEPGDHLVVTDAWVLMSRPRANNLLVDDLRRLQEKLAGGCDIPAGPLALVSPPSDVPVDFEAVNFRGLSDRGNTSGGKAPQELYFPLPYNGEQVTIVSRLERAAGVTVQGPPGTGKTHTIANIVCHYLATGRRVLVTSKGEPALKVLQSKIPEEIQPLTVALLTSDREGVRQFQASIEAIQHRVSQLNPQLVKQEIVTLHQAIDRAHAELSAIDQRVDEIAMSQLSEMDVDGAPLRAQKLAELVVSGHDQHAWFDDVISLDSEHIPPLSHEQAGRLREARRALAKDLVYAQAHVPSADNFPNPADIAELHGVLCQFNDLNAQEQAGQLLPLKACTQEVLAAARVLLARVEEAKVLVGELEASAGGWPLELRVKCRLPSFVSERKALEALFSDLDSLVEARAEFLKRPVELDEAALATPKTREAIKRAAETGKPFGFISIGAGDSKEHIASVKVAGLGPTGPDDWRHVDRYVVLHEQTLSFLARWNEFADDLSVPKLSGGVSKLRQIEFTAILAKKAHRVATYFDGSLPKEAQAIFVDLPAANLTGSSAHLEEVRSHLHRQLTRADLSRAATELSTLQEKLAGKTGPISDIVRHFVENELGNAALPAERAAARFAEIMAELRRIAGLGVELGTVLEMTKRLEMAGAPKLSARIRTMPVASTGEDTVFPSTWREAWTWARMKGHLDNIEAREELLALAGRRRGLEGGLAKLYRDMVGKAAWLATKRNATPKVLQALAGYSTAIRRIGQGTGPNAIRYRRDARDSMLDAAGAVPCWIMSHFKISESMPADIGTFDLVIVDEASQSDLWALPAILRGAKILVVGDDKQVSPDGGFIDSQRIVELKNRFLADQPYGIEMTPEKSLYDLAARVFAAEQVMLREHFRCVPPIIAYSNKHFYKGGIAPLRIPKASERIDPPLVDIFVPQGQRDTHDHNVQEARAIAAEIESILANEQFVGRTIGVVSLLGMDQAKYIDSIVRGQCDAAELFHRKFECGDARTFQGSERDIMFLSMVVDPSSCKAISGNMFDQRFNVAASRARDRMYLVRSVQRKDLSEKDLRVTMLDHFDKPLVTDKVESEVLIDRCESGFERQVYSELVNRGYRVIPQVKTGAYRLDMVVEGAGDMRLAIECDGDEFHGPDRWQQDMSRQRVLERAGWIFWRCFASTWSLRKQVVVSELLARLAGMGIEPMGAIERAPSLVEKRIWQPTDNISKPLDETQKVLEAAVLGK